MTGYLVVPCWMGDKLQTLQFIPPEKGDKLNLPKASFNDGFFTVGKITDKVYLCEGIGQAWAINKATGAAAIVCFVLVDLTELPKWCEPKCQLLTWC
jgi:putative DNA primase/helicase